MTITLKKNSVDVRVELRRNDSDFIGDDRAYYTYFFSKAGCFGSAKVTEKEVYPIDCESFTTKEKTSRTPWLLCSRTFSSLLLSSTKKMRTRATWKAP